MTEIQIVYLKLLPDVLLIQCLICQSFECLVSLEAMSEWQNCWVQSAGGESYALSRSRYSVRRDRDIDKARDCVLQFNVIMLNIDYRHALESLMCEGTVIYDYFGSEAIVL